MQFPANASIPFQYKPHNRLGRFLLIFHTYMISFSSFFDLLVICQLSQYPALLPTTYIKEVLGQIRRGIGLASFDTVSPCTSMPSLVRCRWSPVVGWWNRSGIRILQTKPKSHFVSPLSMGVGTVGTDRTDCLKKQAPQQRGDCRGASYIKPPCEECLTKLCL